MKLERLINGKWNDDLVEVVFPKNNESKNLVNVTGDRDLEMYRDARKNKLKVKMVRMLLLI